MLTTVAALMTIPGMGAMAQELAKDGENPGFFKQAFMDMKESAKKQWEIDKANFLAVKLESRAFFQEQKAKSHPSARKLAQEQDYLKQIAAAKARQEAAQKRIDATENK